MLCSQTGVGGVEGQNGTFYPIRTVRLNGRDVEDPNIGVDNVHGFVCVCGGGGPSSEKYGFGGSVRDFRKIYRIHSGRNCLTEFLSTEILLDRNPIDRNSSRQTFHLTEIADSFVTKIIFGVDVA